jgi:pSer/pThr/pTyr-binding forkhead associated (FHA) protein
MVRFNILSGKKAGQIYEARHFPVRIGRSPGNTLQLEEPGMWDRHAELKIKPGAGISMSVLGGASALLNGSPAVEPVILRNGDLIELGGTRLQFWLSEPAQSGMAWREWLTWSGIALVCLAQVFLIYLLLRE